MKFVFAGLTAGKKKSRLDRMRRHPTSQSSHRDVPSFKLPKSRLHKHPPRASINRAKQDSALLALIVIPLGSLDTLLIIYRPTLLIISSLFKIVVVHACMSCPFQQTCTFQIQLIQMQRTHPMPIHPFLSIPNDASNKQKKLPDRIRRTRRPLRFDNVT